MSATDNWLIQQIFRKSKDANREFMRRAHLCSLKGWPDRKRELEVAFELQLLLLSQREMRFGHLLKTGVIQHERVLSLLEVSERLGGGWGDMEEMALAESDPEYRKLNRAIGEHRRALNADAIDGPLRDLQRDPEYRQARQEYFETLKQLDAQFELASKQ